MARLKNKIFQDFLNILFAKTIILWFY